MYETVWNPASTREWNCKTLLEREALVRGDGSQLLGIGWAFSAFPNQYVFKADSLVSAEEAERLCWEKYQAAKPRLCQHDHFNGDNCERRTYRNGAGFCKFCGYFCMDVFEPLEVCVNCGRATYWTHDKNGGWWCQGCSHLIPKENRDPTEERIDEVMESEGL